MKLIQQLLEMAKSSTKRAKQKKRRKLKKSETGGLNAVGNPVAHAMQTSGAGGHGTQKTKDKRGRASRREGKQQTRDY